MRLGLGGKGYLEGGDGNEFCVSPAVEKLDLVIYLFIFSYWSWKRVA